MSRGAGLFFLIGVITVLVAICALYVWYQCDSRHIGDQPPHFDLFIAEKFFPDEVQSPFDTVPEGLRRPVTWKLKEEQFHLLDTVVVELHNTSGEKFYYTSWGSPLTRLRTDLVVYREGVADSIPFGGFGCYTGVFVAPVLKDQTISRTIYNPLMFDPWSNYELPLEADTFPDLFRMIYGDSVGIRFSQATYGSPWNKYPSQMLFSQRLTVRTQVVLDHWKAGRFARFPAREPTMEEHFGIKNFPQ